MKTSNIFAIALLAGLGGNTLAAETPTLDPATRGFFESIRDSTSRKIGPAPLYETGIPNSKPGPDAESLNQMGAMEAFAKVSHPTYTAYLPPPSRASRSAVIIFPGGGYHVLSWSWEGPRIAEALQDRGVAAILVKYRLPSDDTMIDKSIGPLQDAQQALLQVRRHAKEWGVDPQMVGVMGFSAGGHLASTVGTHFDAVLVPNPDELNVRPDFMILVYPLISMADNKTHMGSREALLGSHPGAEQIRRFSSDLQVSERTPPSLLLAAENDSVVDVDNSIDFYQALRHHAVPAELILFPQGQHGFFQLSLEEWMVPLSAWLARNGWLRP
jgi:acetyl esterase/lipase